MKITAFLLATILSIPLAAQTNSSQPDPWKELSFLQGTWEAKTQGEAGIISSGTYTFRMELGDHILARHSNHSGECKGPANFDCHHTDLLYLYQEGTGQALKAIYFDNEGHVIHYTALLPNTSSLELISDPTQQGPQFRLLYELKGTILFGKFQMRMPGQQEWKSYLEWSGPKSKPE